MIDRIEIDELERVLLRSIVERRETCRQAAESVMAYLKQVEAQVPLMPVYGSKPVD